MFNHTFCLFRSMESTFMFLYSLAAWLDWPFSLELSSLISMKTRYWVMWIIMCRAGSVRNLKSILHCLRYLGRLPLRLTYQSYILQAWKYGLRHTWSILATKLKPGMIAIHHTLVQSCHSLFTMQTCYQMETEPKAQCIYRCSTFCWFSLM